MQPHHNEDILPPKAPGTEIEVFIKKNPLLEKKFEEDLKKEGNPWKSSGSIKSKIVNRKKYKCICLIYVKCDLKDWKKKELPSKDQNLALD